MQNFKHIVVGVASTLLCGMVMAQSITIATGESKKGYSKLFNNINAVCGQSVPLQELNTGGGLDNLSEVAGKKAHLGLVQVDVFQAMEKTDDAIGRLKAVMSLNSNLLHIIVSQSGFQANTGKEICDGKEILGKCLGNKKPVFETRIIKTEQDLKGLNIAAVGSAQMMARKLLNDRMKLNVNITDADKDVDAFALLKQGKVQAVLSVAAAPHGFIDKLKQADGVTLANWSSAPSSSYRLVKKNYKNIGVFGVSFLAAPNLLMARPLDPNGDVGLKITKLKTCIKDNLKKLQDGDDFEPSWSDASNLNPPDDIPGWTGTIATSAKSKK